jgi:hypothetical protein
MKKIKIKNHLFRGRGRSPVRSSCLTVRSCSLPLLPSPLVPAAPPLPTSSIFSLFRIPRVASRETRQTADVRPLTAPAASPRSRDAAALQLGRKDECFPLWPHGSRLRLLPLRRAPLVRRNQAAPCSTATSSRPRRPQLTSRRRESPLHVKRRTEEAPGPPVAGAHTAWEDADQVSFAVPRFPHRQAWARAA